MNSVFKNEIPFYTNSNQQRLAWYAMYNNTFIKEFNHFVTVPFNSIPKNDVLEFGLYGTGYHFNTDLITGSLSIENTERQLFRIEYSISNSLLIDNKCKLYNTIPFELKGYDYDIDIMNPKCNTKNNTNKFYCGYNGQLLLDNKFPVNVHNYFLILFNATIERPYRAIVISKLCPINGIIYNDMTYYLSMYEITNKVNYTQHKINLSKGECYIYKTIIDIARMRE